MRSKLLENHETMITEASDVWALTAYSYVHMHCRSYKNFQFGDTLIEMK